VEVCVANSEIAEDFMIFISGLYSDLRVAEYQKELVIDHAIGRFCIVPVLSGVVCKIIQTPSFFICEGNNETFLSQGLAWGIFS